MGKRPLDLLALAATIVGLGASVAATIDDLGPAAAFCAETGCETVRASAWARPLGIPMSVLGLGFFSVMLGLAFVPRPRLRAALAIAGGAWALGLLALQAFVIGAWCKLCLVADPAAIVLAIAVVRGAGTFVPRRRGLALAGLAQGTVIALLAAWTRAPGAEPAKLDATAFATPAPTSSAKVTIVELVDFECPFCREMQRRLDEAIARTSVEVELVRRMVPLPSHAGALPAALAYCCAEAQGKGEEMARALFEADPAELTDAGCERIAARIGCDLARYRAARADAERRVAADVEAAKAAGVRGLPTLFIGEQHVTGASLSVDELVAAIERAAAS